jgi:nucleoside-diphosphate-sugar epimerase
MATHKETIILGRDGFIGSTLAERKLPHGIYYFDSPSSNILFDEDFDWCARKTVDGFLGLLARIRNTKEYLVYPSSATIYNKNTHYARIKSVLEELHLASGLPALGLRIAAGYGPNERHKGRFASVVYQWCQQMKVGERPVIFGDGTQTRDFIYQDDIADTIKKLADEHTLGIVDIGTGINTTFNEVVQTINYVLGTHIEPVYVEKPKNYVPETPVKAVETKVSLEEGIERIIKSI